MRWIIAIILALAPLSVSAEEKTWLCLLDKATGFIFKNGEWKQGPFDTSLRFLLKQSGDTWTWAKFGESRSVSCTPWEPVGYVAECRDDVQGFTGPDAPLCGLICTGRNRFEYTHINLKSLQFTVSIPGGWVNTPSEKPDTPILALGTCALL